MFDNAIQRATELDEHYKQTGKTVGPLHGLPISLKDNFNIAGKTSATGFCAWAEEPMQTDSTIVQMLRELGAVAYVKTNVPTAMMIAESVNNCYGRYAHHMLYLTLRTLLTPQQNRQPTQSKPYLWWLLWWRISPDRSVRKSIGHWNRYRRLSENPSSHDRNLHHPSLLRSLPSLRRP